MAKVCHMTSVHRQGDPRIFLKECTSLAKAGHDVYLVIRGESGQQNGVNIIGVGEPSGGRFSRIALFSKRVYKAALEVDADIYHLHDPELLPYAVRLHRKGKKVIFDSHEIYPMQIRTKSYLPRALRSIISLLYKAYEQYVCGKIDGLIYPCTLTGKEDQLTACRHRELINNVPILEELYDFYDESVQKENRSICYIGSLTEARGVSNLIAVAEKADCTLWLAGSFGSAAYEQEVMPYISSGRVCYLGQVNHTEIRNLLQRMQIGMVTLRNVGQYHAGNNLPTKTYEYMCMGIPVIQNHSAYNDKVMEECSYGISVDPDNIDEIVDAVHYLLDHPEKAKQMGQNGRRAVKDKFNWGLEENKLIALYNTILAE